jgi:CheY-like chemotaxis protein
LPTKHRGVQDNLQIVKTVLNDKKEAWDYRDKSGKEVRGAEIIFNPEKPDIMLLDIHLPGMDGNE